MYQHLKGYWKKAIHLLFIIIIYRNSVLGPTTPGGRRDHGPITFLRSKKKKGKHPLLPPPSPPSFHFEIHFAGPVYRTI